MASRDRKLDAGPTRGLHETARAPAILSFGAVVFKVLAISLGVTFLAGAAIGIYETLYRSNSNATHLGFFASNLVGQVIIVPAELAIGGLNLPKGTADILFSVTSKVVIPYQVFAYAGAYSWGTILEIKGAPARP